MGGSLPSYHTGLSGARVASLIGSSQPSHTVLLEVAGRVGVARTPA